MSVPSKVIYLVEKFVVSQNENSTNFTKNWTNFTFAWRHQIKRCVLSSPIFLSDALLLKSTANYMKSTFHDPKIVQKTDGAAIWPKAFNFVNHTNTVSAMYLFLYGPHNVYQCKWNRSRYQPRLAAEKYTISTSIDLQFVLDSLFFSHQTIITFFGTRNIIWHKFSYNLKFKEYISCNTWKYTVIYLKYFIHIYQFLIIRVS